MGTLTSGPVKDVYQKLVWYDTSTKKLKSKKYNIRFNRHDWIDEMFFNLEKQSGAK